MPASHATIATASASRYLQQLCKHWSHKLKVEFTPEKGSIDFGDGRVCRLVASEDTLALDVEAGDAEMLARAERVVVEHLKRFAFREDLGEVAFSKVA